jgi:hypothetical protein
VKELDMSRKLKRELSNQIEKKQLCIFSNAPAKKKTKKSVVQNALLKNVFLYTTQIFFVFKGSSATP